jgi:uncharacterized membrane protein
VIFENPQLLALLLLIPALIGIWVWRGMRIVPTAMVIRMVMVALVIVALANPTRGQRIESSGPVVILVDQSDSLTPQGQQALQAEANNLVQTLRAGEEEDAPEAAVLWFGANTVMPGSPNMTSDAQELPTTLTTSLNPSASDLAGALRTARDLIGPGVPAPDSAEAQTGQIVLLSDGIETSGDAVAEARLMAEAGIQVDVVPLEVSARPELRIAQMTAPRTLHVGEEYTVQIMVSSTAPDGQTSATAGTLRLWKGSEVLAEEQVELEPGNNPFSFTDRATDPGTIRLRAEIVGDPDTFERNNHAAATALVSPPPRVLLVEGQAGAAQQFASALWNAGVESEAIQADRMPTRLSQLESFDGMILFNVPSHMLTFDQMTSVQEFVRSEGRGLVVTGGTESYSLGGYENTPLEKVLPVNMEAPPRPDREDVAMLLIIDRSASMDTALGVSKFDMAKEAAILSVDSLRPEDTIGVLAFDTTQQWAVPFQPIGEGTTTQAIKDSIATLPTGGGTDIYAALHMGLTNLQQQQTNIRHVVLLTDGRSFTDDQVAYRQLAESALAQDITISTIAIGYDSDTELLDSIAQWGGGRYYFADDPEDIPQLTLQESEIARSDTSVEGQFNAALQEPHALMRDFSDGQLPQLDGYVATTAKDEAEVVLVSPDDDPVLATWQYGLGRAVAWTPSATEPWASGWLNWDQYGRFWAQIVRYTLPEADSGALQVELTPQPGGAHLEADAVRANGAPLDLADAVAQVTLPDGTEETFNLRQVGPGRYAQDLLLPDDGPYGILAVLVRNDTQYRAATGYVQEVPAEYQPPPEGDTLQGQPLLEEVARITGGEVRAMNTSFEVDTNSSTTPESTQAQSGWSNLWMWLLGAALLLWLLEIAVRRGVFIRND